jgi:short-subunit dehydrogenase
MRYPKLAARFPGRRAFITGAASGLGYALALELVNDGWLVGINDADADRLAIAHRQLRALNGRVLAFPFDVASETDYRLAAHSFLAAAGGIDLLVNNAGLGGGGGIGEFSLADWRKLMDVNVLGVVHGCHIFLPAMQMQGRGHILNIASAAAYHSLPFIGAYNATKAAVVSITETLHAENAGSGISASVMISAFYKSDIARFTLGGDLATKRTLGLTKLASATAQEMASQTLHGLQKSKPYIVLTRDGRAIYFMKRHFPQLFLRLAPRIAKAAFAKAEAA